MAEGFDLYHVPQQRRRDKLRLANLQLQGLLPIYDPSSVFSSDYMTGGEDGRCSGEDRGGGGVSVCTGVKDEGGNYMANYVVGGNNSYMMDPRSSSIQLNPTSIQEIELHNPFLYNPQSFRFFNACSQGLSLSLSSNHTQQSTLPLELNNHQNYEHDSTIYSGKMGSFVTRNSSNVNELSRSSVPLGPFTGYASVLKGSRFLGPAQQLLEEICDVGEGNYPEKLSADTVLLDPLMEKSVVVDNNNSQSCNLGSDQRRKKSRLMLLLDEVYKRYKQYCHQMQAVVASFESVSGVKNAAPFASMAVKSMSKHFNFLRNAISDQLQQFLTEPRHHHHHVVSKEKEHVVVPGFDTSVNGMFDFVQHQPVWRPQRGLPERAVTVLRAWLFDHFLHPYPTDTDKLMLAKQTGLSRNQVSNWFINARVRLWKPMVEEIHMLESKQAQKSTQDQEINNVDSENNQTIPTPSNNIPMITSTTVQRIDDNNTDMSMKRARINESNVDATMTAEKNALMDRNYEHISSFPRMGFGVSSGGTNGSVSLTLGLQQNNGASRLTDPFSLSAARRLGLVDPNGEEYLAGGWH